MTQPAPVSRHTVDSITSDALGALYEQLDAAQQTELARQLATCDKAFASATLRAARAETRAYKAEAALDAVRVLADELVQHGNRRTGNEQVLGCRILATLDAHTNPKDQT
ncbi:acyl-CoA reductase-like NAD-dependent aldehyde dehydrogenase [Streptomyces sp. PvR006]|uniref:hypothetical protein n=1 Tax=Streptomyces sp. PvR006 TaxID=2817860 RepID=UPI001AE42848|nr:hypothetical protein [Streptomyces sp. PvR006]MBP2581881.1 acyl-CoA reductase-like NAD-dependent aldehyde dehydrogenase [Streptomyces sp. PvR006]